MNLVKKDKVGEGGSWKVFQCEAMDYQFEWPLVLKVSKGKSPLFIQHNIRIHEQIQSLGLPTLALLKTVTFADELAMIGEYLNTNGWLFVSPNRVITDLQRAFRLQETGTTVFDNEPLAEQILYDHKLSELHNFQDFLDNAIRDLKIASRAKLELYFDSYFFGFKRGHTRSEIQYKIGDFDQIFYKPRVPETELLAYNIGEFNDTMQAFIRNFIVTANQPPYLEMTMSKLAKRS